MSRNDDDDDGRGQGKRRGSVVAEAANDAEENRVDQESSFSTATSSAIVANTRRRLLGDTPRLDVNLREDEESSTGSNAHKAQRLHVMDAPRGIGSGTSPTSPLTAHNKRADRLVLIAAVLAGLGGFLFGQVAECVVCVFVCCVCACACVCLCVVLCCVCARPPFSTCAHEWLMRVLPTLTPLNRYDVGVISGALLQLEVDFDLGDLEKVCF